MYNREGHSTSSDNKKLLVEKDLIKIVRIGVVSVSVVLILMVLGLLILLNPEWLPKEQKPIESNRKLETRWAAPDSTSIQNLPNADLVLYGKELIAHTALYLGPSGSVAQMSNGMNCQNCHLKRGTQFFGNNYSAVASTYPKFRARSGSMETVEKRVNDCLERSLNGKSLNDDSREMKAFVAYITWVGNRVPKDSIPLGAGIFRLKYLNRAADPVKGMEVFKENCIRCHGENGKGIKRETGNEWRYPPLHGDSSYNVGAGLYRISMLAGFVKYNMPNDVTSFDKPLLTDEEAWDVAAYLNSLFRPVKEFSHDWPDISKKPVDHPFGPYADEFSEEQHKFGPFDKMVKSK